MTKEKGHTLQENRTLSKKRQPIKVILFPDGKHPVSDVGLPLVRTVEDIDTLSRNQLIKYLRGYRMDYSEKLPNVRLKEQLKHAVGLAGTYDNIFIFSE